jgi:antitoxin component YwqK of YwqJK toxin-antitoxin module
MEILNYICRKYISDPTYVFKSCGNYIIVLQKLPDTITNESRSEISDPMYAKYRANKLRVILIINKFDPFDVIKQIKNTSYIDKTIIYKTDKIVKVKDYNMNLDEVYTKGLHYFKTIKQAFYWDIVDLNPKYTGSYIEWYNNGNKSCEGIYLYGKEIGQWSSWYENGNNKKLGIYYNGKEIGKWISWHENGNKEYEGEYFNGKQTGIWIHWFSNGIKWEEGEYLDGKRIKKWIFWHPNGNKNSEGKYFDGKQAGTWIYWHPNGDIHCEKNINIHIKKF